MSAAGFSDTADYNVETDDVDVNGTRYLKVTVGASWSRIGLRTIGFVRSDKIEGTATMRYE
jgi:hypothetical protein